jgi:hypothetical protein
MSDEIDNDFVTGGEFPFRDTLRWWETRRIWFCLVVIAMQSLMVWTYWDAILDTGVQLAIVLSSIHLFLANVCYCAGWGFEFILAYYWKSNQPRLGLRRALFVLGSLFTVPVTYVLYSDTYWLHSVVI